ncbi:uncharacterized protein MEPE_02728 [Melanopsichium pennsylvanicum]|uniref:Uncharacterized protein n=1 Tax=Melanopsichium pennsylvanicum TaxID=63383 RepID=A0AAJ4XK85_9BASI|nr:uncharacterized protein MEPE_02728 [Melanopsichium pennsylvanicum]
MCSPGHQEDTSLGLRPSLHTIQQFAGGEPSQGLCVSSVIVSLANLVAAITVSSTFTISPPRQDSHQNGKLCHQPKHNGRSTQAASKDERYEHQHAAAPPEPTFRPRH